jgi:hypothetical protein
MMHWPGLEDGSQHPAPTEPVDGRIYSLSLDVPGTDCIRSNVQIVRLQSTIPMTDCTSGAVQELAWLQTLFCSPWAMLTPTWSSITAGARYRPRALVVSSRRYGSAGAPPALECDLHYRESIACGVHGVQLLSRLVEAKLLAAA